VEGGGCRGGNGERIIFSLMALGACDRAYNTMTEFVLTAAKLGKT
jgi:hypothetical protein